MPLIKKLWIAVITVMILAFGGSMLASILSSQKYLQSQLEMKNNDNASSLAISLSKLDDETATELMISAQFDNGHYQYINLIGEDGSTIVEKSNKHISSDVPSWFSHLIPIKANPGVAFVQRGWTPVGTLHVMSDSTFAYDALWNGVLSMLLWISIIALFTGLVGSIMVRKAFAPIKALVDQAEAIGDKRFVTLQEPAILEFRVLVAAMNRLSSRIKTMLSDQATLLDSLRREANYEPVSGLMNRKYFTSRVTGFIANDDSFTEGALVVIHIDNLKEINQELGEKQTDLLLKKMGELLREYTSKNKSLNTLCGRLTGADLAIFIGTPINKFEITNHIQNLIISGVNSPVVTPATLFVLTNTIHRDDKIEGLNQWVSPTKTEDKSDSAQAAENTLDHERDLIKEQNEENAWHTKLTESIEAERVALASYPVMDTKGNIIHYESPVRMQLEHGGFWLPANEFILWATRLNLMPKIDELVLKAAVKSLLGKDINIGLNISTRAICDLEFLDRMIDIIKEHPEVAPRLWLEVPEMSVFNHLSEFEAFCEKIKPLGCKIGVEHIGSKVSRLGDLFDFGVDYIKVDVSVIRGIDKNPGNIAFLKGLCLIGHSMGLKVIAEGVESQDEIQCLPNLGIDGYTGPGVKELG